jgi:Flp pilus assembly protein TadD
MPSHIDRAELLYNQSRYDLAEQELRQALTEQPHDDHAHALLGLCLMRQDKLPEAQDEVQQAIVLAPDEPFPHYCRAVVLQHRRRYQEAEESAREALRLSPGSPDFHAQHAAILFQQEKWQEALDASLAGLQFDAEHAGCGNLRTMALTKLGRRGESLATVDESLARDPDDEMAHANKGWALLHDGQPRPALEHFREALRLDPNYEYAQSGIVEALKARNPLYRWMLAYFLWMARLSDGVKWGVILGGYFGYRTLGNVARSNPELAPWITPLLVLYLGFVLLTWFSVPFFNLLLRINKFGRHALSRDQRIGSNWFGLCLLVVLGGIAVGFLTPYEDAFVFAIYGAGMAMPLVNIYHCDSGWPRQAMTAMAVGMATVGAGAIGCMFADIDFGGQLFFLFLIGFIATPWLANYLVGVTVKR